MHGIDARISAAIARFLGLVLSAAGADELASRRCCCWRGASARRCVICLGCDRRSRTCSSGCWSAGVLSDALAPLAMMRHCRFGRCPQWLQAARSTARSDPVIYTRRLAGRCLACCSVFRRFFVAAGRGLDDVEPGAAAHGHVDDRPELRGDRHQARQRADRGRWSSCWASSPGWRRTRRCRTTTAPQQGLPPLEKLDDEKVLVWPDLVYTELICMVAPDGRCCWSGHRLAGPAGRAGQQRQDAQPVEGPVVLPRACRKCSSTTIPGWPAWCCPAW